MESALALTEDHTQWSDPVFRSSYRLIATDAEWAVLDTLPRAELPPYLRIFWKRRDPTPTTEPNEFRTQFEQRVKIATERYRAVPTPAPWDARGEMLIKLGTPDVQLPYVHSFGRMGSIFGPSVVIPGESWLYGGYFDNEYLNVLFWQDGVRVTYAPSVNQNLAETTHVAYQPPPGLKEVGMALDWYPFRRLDGDYDVYVACATPVQELVTRSDTDTTDLKYMARLVLFDSTYHPVWTDSAQVALQLNRVARGMLAQNRWEIVLPPGFYIAATEIEGLVNMTHPTGSFKRWLVPYADSVGLDLSPLVMAASAGAVTDSSSGLVRNGRAIVPMPGHVFRSDQDVAFYHEIYDLRPDSSGVCYYQIEYSLYDRDGRNQRSLFADEFASRERETFQAGQIPHKKLGKGQFILEAKTIDLNAGITKTALAHFMIK